MWTDKKNILIAIGSCVLIALVIIIINLFTLSKNDKQTGSAILDPTFEMMDPENPLTTVDNIAKKKGAYKELNAELKYLDKFISNLKRKIQDISSITKFPKIFALEKRLSSEGAEFLNNFGVESLFDALDENETYDLEYRRDVNVNESIKIYFSKRKEWSNALRILLEESNLPPRLGSSYFSSYNAVRYERYDDYDTTQKLAIDLQPLQQLQPVTKTFLEKLNQEFLERKSQVVLEMGSLKTEYLDLIDKYSKSRFDMSGKAISYGIIAFVVIAIVLYIAGLIARNKMRKDSNKDDVNLHEDLKTSMWYSVYMITVLLLIITIFILGLARLLQENTLAALLGGIAGYVLNNKISDPVNITGKSGVINVSPSTPITPPQTPPA